MAQGSQDVRKPHLLDRHFHRPQCTLQLVPNSLTAMQHRRFCESRPNLNSQAIAVLAEHVYTKQDAHKYITLELSLANSDWIAIVAWNSNEKSQKLKPLESSINQLFYPHSASQGLCTAQAGLSQSRMTTVSRECHCPDPPTAYIDPSTGLMRTTPFLSFSLGPGQDE